MHVRSLAPILFAALVAPACAPFADDPGSTDEDLRTHPPNAPAGYDRVQARITCSSTQLRYRPGADTPDNRVVGASSTLLRRGRHVVVQGRVAHDGAAPGNLDGFVWINPDASDVPPDQLATYRAEHPDVSRRGWVPASCLDPAPGETEPIPTESDSTLTPNGNGAVWGHTGTVRHVRAGCVVDGTYSGVRPDLRHDVFSYANYGTKGFGDAVPVSFSTTTVEGGGTVFGYLFAGDAFDVVYVTPHADSNQLSGSVPARWAYGHGVINGRAGTWGWVWADCLEGLSASEAPPSPPPSDPAPSPPPPASSTEATCFVRCCDGALEHVDSYSDAECRDDYTVCWSGGHGPVRAIQRNGVYLYQRPTACP